MTDSKDPNLALPKKNNGFLCRSNDVAEMLTSCQGAARHRLPQCWKRAPAVLCPWSCNKGSCCDLVGGRGGWDDDDTVHFS